MATEAQHPTQAELAEAEEQAWMELIRACEEEAEARQFSIGVVWLPPDYGPAAGR